MSCEMDFGACGFLGMGCSLTHGHASVTADHHTVPLHNRRLVHLWVTLIAAPCRATLAVPYDNFGHSLVSSTPVCPKSFVWCEVR